MSSYKKLRSAALIVVAASCIIVPAASAAEPSQSDIRDVRPPQVCTEQYAPVCGEKNGVTKTYSSACFAAAGGAKVIAQGPCR